TGILYAVLAAEPGGKDDLAPVRSPCQIADARAVEGQSLRFAAVHGDEIDFADQRADHSHKGQSLTVGRKSRTAISDDGRRRRRHATFLSGFRREQKEAERLLGRCLVAHDQPSLVRRPVNPGMASKAEAIGPYAGQLSLGAAERRDEEYSISVGRTAIKSYRAAVRRPDGIHIVTR